MKEELLKVQCFTQRNAHPSNSEKYQLINTLDIIEELEKHSWSISSFREINCRNGSHHEGFQKHMVTMKHNDITYNGSSPEVAILNAHDRSWRLKMLGGIRVSYCDNGLIFAKETFESFVITHIGTAKEKAVEATQAIIENMPKVVHFTDKLKNIKLSDTQQFNFGDQALSLAYREEFWQRNKKYSSIMNFIQPKREADEGGSLWNVFNITQEKLLRKSEFIVDSKHHIKARKEVTNVNQIVRLNQNLWNLAEQASNDIALIS
jgi:hypothetical protein